MLPKYTTPVPFEPDDAHTSLNSAGEVSALTCATHVEFHIGSLVFVELNHTDQDALSELLALPDALGFENDTHDDASFFHMPASELAFDTDTPAVPQPRVQVDIAPLDTLVHSSATGGYKLKPPATAADTVVFESTDTCH